MIGNECSGLGLGASSSGRCSSIVHHLLMKVSVIATHADGSNLYRMTLPALQNGASIVETPFLEPPDADVLVINRPVSRDYIETIIQLEEDGYAVVVDVDDAFGYVRPAHSMFARAEGIDGLVKWACREATLVTCATPKLAEIYGGEVVPNYIPEWYLNCKQIPHDGPLRLGWSGTISSHPGNLEVTDGQVARALNETGSDFTLIGPREQIEDIKVALKYKRNALVSGWFTFDQYPHAMAQMDVGIVPLCDTIFDQSKSWLKGLEFAAVGVPFVASPTEEYIKLNKLGAGLLARYPNEWRKHCKALLESKDMREELAGRGREVASKLTIEARGSEWNRAWIRAWVRKNGRLPA